MVHLENKKVQMREQAREKRAGLLGEDQGLRSFASERVRLVLDDILKDVHGLVAGYRSQPFEVDMDPWLIARPLEQLCFPVMSGQKLEFYKVESWADFKVGANKILEPVQKPELKVKLDNIQAFLVPGLCYDRRGFRLGSGHGYYDRTLEKVSALKVGIGFAKMVFTENLPVDAYDIPMDWVVTEDFVFQPMISKGAKQ